MQSKDNVSAVIPYIRPDKVQRVITACRAEGVGEIIAHEDNHRVGCPKMLEFCVNEASKDLVCFLGDDTIPQPGFLDAALKAMDTLPDGWGVVGLNSQASRHAAHFLADKRMLDLLPDKQFFNTAYKHCFCDNELTDIAQEHGRFVFCDDAVVTHDHPIFTGAEEDADYKRVYNKATWQHDRSLYYQRKRDRLKGGIAIGFPLISDMVPSTFFQTYATMAKPESYLFLTPTVPHGEIPKSLAAARNSIVETAQNAGCSHLLMMDTDQGYPPDTLTKLLSHNVDICGVLVHRGWFPFEPILQRGTSAKFKYVGDDEAFSGKLIEVDATGTGCLLIKMEVFDELVQPYFFEGVVDGEWMGEDFYFCIKAKKAGKHIFVDTSVEVDHLRRFAINKTVYQIFKQLSGGKQNG